MSCYRNSTSIAGPVHACKTRTMSLGILTEIPAFGHGFRLGSVFDCRKSCLVDDISLWNQPLQPTFTASSKASKLSFKIVPDDKLSTKLITLGVKDEMRLSLLTGLIKETELTKYVTDCCTSSNQVRIVLQCKCITKREKIAIDKIPDVENTDFLQDDFGTHVVTEVHYGAEGYFIFDCEVTADEKPDEVHKYLQNLVKKVAIEGKEIDGAGLLKERVSCKFYGTFQLPKEVSTFEDALPVFSQLQQTFAEGNENEVPVLVSACPINQINTCISPKIAVMSQEKEYSQFVESVMETCHQLVIQSNDIAKQMPHFLCIQQQLLSASEAIKVYQTDFISKIADALPILRRGDDFELKSVFEEHTISSNIRNISNWINGKKKESAKLQAFIAQLSKPQRKYNRCNPYFMIYVAIILQSPLLQASKFEACRSAH